MVMKNIVVQSIDQVPYDVWVFPGIILLIASVSTFSLIYRDLFDLRIHKKSNSTNTPVANNINRNMEIVIDK